MGFLFPEFLFCLALIAIPVIIHLFNFRRFKKVYFTNVNFLKDVQTQTASAQTLKERLILLCRILAIFFLVMAFAQPFIKSENQSQSFQKTVVSIYLDNSYSMEAVNKNGTLLDEGKRKVKDLVAAYGLNDKFQLLTNNFDANSQRLLTRDELLDELENVKIAPWTRSYQQVINQQQFFLQNQHQVSRVAYLVSDFQKQPNVAQTLQKEEGITFTLIPLSANNLPNISIDSVYFLSPIHQPNQSEKLVYKLSNHSTKDVENIPLSLKINGVQKAIANSSIKANAFVLDTLSFSGSAGNWQKATLSIKDYPIIFDDGLNFVFEVQHQLNITAIYDNEPVKSIGVAYGTDPFFKFSAINQTQINYSNLASQQLIILENLTEVPTGLAQQLKQYVKNGGSLSIFIPLKADLASYKTFLQSLQTDFPLSLELAENKVNKINLDHPMFKDVFDQYPKNIDLPIAKQFFKSSDLTRTTKQILFGGTASNNLLSAYQLGKGKIYISFLPLEATGSNFAQHALFLPILFKSALLGFNQQNLFYTLGADKNVTVPAVPVSENETVNIKGNGADVIPTYQNNGANSSIYFADQLKQTGFYNVFLKDSLLKVFALNQDRGESALSFYSQNELDKIFQIPEKNIINSKEKITGQQIKEVTLGSSLWKLCLILTLIFLAAEVLLIRFYKNLNVQSKKT
ncbi:MAG TPA: BatA domain-containing protein [Pelobium sp.]|nr:BatA domain-containing protein [Pelobium sp.]